jgi:hypothetical protein
MPTSNNTCASCGFNAETRVDELQEDRASEATAQTPVAAVNQAYTCPPRGLVGRLGLLFVRAVGQLRRQYLSRFRRGYIQRMKAERQGECRRCGSCCNLTFNCPFHTDTVGCRIYEKRPRTCRDFPIDAKDLRLTRVPCGHHYEKPEDDAGANSAG